MRGARRSSRIWVLPAACLVVGGGATLWGAFAAREAFFAAWLAAFYFWLGVPVGALALLLIHDLTGGLWERTARPALEAAAASLPLFVLLFLPVMAGLPALYPWARAGETAGLMNRWYLNADFFAARAGAYFAIWILVVALKLWWPRAPLPLWLAGIGVILVGLTVAFASIDWLMSTEPYWFSSIYPMVAGAGQFIASLSLVLVVVACTGRSRGPDAEAFRDDLANLATLLLAVVIFWAYTSFCQFLIIWESNLSDEIGWYIERVRGAWRSVAYALAAAHFFVPFIALVTTPAKRSRAIVGGAAGLLFVADLLQVWWLALPRFATAGLIWLAPAVAIFMGGAVGLVFLFALRSRDRVALGAMRPAERLGHG